MWIQRSKHSLYCSIDEFFGLHLFDIVTLYQIEHVSKDLELFVDPIFFGRDYMVCLISTYNQEDTDQDSYNRPQMY